MENIVVLCYICLKLVALKCLHYYCIITVGEDFSTITGKEVITAVFDKGSKTASVKILLHIDLLDEATECFTAELKHNSSDCVSSTNVCITDTHTIVCTFQHPSYFAYESDGHVTLTLVANGSIPSYFEVDVDTIYGSGNASGEEQLVCIVCCRII